MNKIVIENDNIVESNIDNTIELNVMKKDRFFNVNRIKLKVIENTNLEIEYISNMDIKIDVFINVLENVNFNIYEYRTGCKTKIQYKYYLEENSYTNVSKFYNSSSIQELNIINLNGRNAKIDYNFKTIASDKEKYDLMIYHNYPNTISNIINHGVSIDKGSLAFNITSIVLNKKENCIVNQLGRIINLNNGKCTINPNLLIEENDVEANHSALIGQFREEEMFYLKSRGLDEKKALNLLIKGFLINGLNINNQQKGKLNQVIDSYWR